MNKYSIAKIIEDFAPIDTQEAWDASGWLVDTKNQDVNNVLLCLTVTQDIINQSKGFDMIISHHPLFSIPIKWSDINIYCAHTNFDKAIGGTTDTLIKDIFGENINIYKSCDNDFVRYIDLDISFDKLYEKLKYISPNLRYINCDNKTVFKKLAFCAGSGSEFISEVFENNADVYITGDIKFHTASESPVALFDIGHFESEAGVLKTFKNLLDPYVKTVIANEVSPFKY